MKRILSISLMLSCFSLLTAFTQLNKLKTLAENTWMIVDTTGILFHGHTAYSGGAYDRTHHQFLIFGGGHTDGFYNDVLALDISAMTWKSMYPTDSSSAYACGNFSSSTPGMLLSSGLPASRHTYDMLDFIDHLGKMIMWSGPTYSNIWSCPGETTPADTWLYSWATNQWEYKNTSRQAQPSGEASCGEYDPVGKLYYAINKDNYFYPVFWSYNPDTDKWTKLATFSDSGSGIVMPSLGGMLTADKKRQRLWAWPNCYDIPTGKWIHFTTAGGPSTGLADAYDEANDVMVAVRGTTVYVYHISGNQWETLNPSNAPDAGSAYGRFFYDPVDNVFMLVTGSGNRAQTWAYRYKGNSSSASQSAPRTLAPTAAMTAYPNPFTTLTAINIKGLHATGKMGIYNLQGQLVKAVAVEKNRERFVWDGKDNQDRSLTPGIYTARISSAEENVSLKLLLNR